MLKLVIFLAFFVAINAVSISKFHKPKEIPQPEIDDIPQTPTIIRSNPNANYQPNDHELQQNQAARYEFSSDIEDNISDLSHRRDETRNGLAVKGSYSYSDGYYERTIHYEADEKGYRVVKQEVVPLLDGPQIDLMGTASVSNNAHGKSIAYKVQSVPVPGPVAKITTEI